MEDMVSIIIPTYNRANTIGRAIQSILHQTYPAYEVIVVDDGSTDGTEEVIRQIGDDRIRYVRQEQNQGASHARNVGIQESRYDYIAFLDSDDEWMPDKLERQMKKMTESAENVGMVYCRMKSGEEGRICPSYDWPTDVPLEGNLFPLLLWRNIIGTPSILIRKVCLKEVGGFRETLHCIEDWELVLRVAQDWMIGFVDKILVVTNQSEGSVTANAGAFLLTRCYMVSLYRKEMEQTGLLSVIRQEIIETAGAYGLEEETKLLLCQDFVL